MHLKPTMKQSVIRRSVRKFAEERIAPFVQEMEETGAFPGDLAREMARLQYFGLQIPSEYGGAGLDSVSSAIVIEEISRVSGAMGLCISVHNSVAAYPVYAFATEDQRRRFLTPLATGESIGTFCLTEPNAGSDASSLETRAVAEGDAYILNGNKVFVTNGGVSGTNLIFSYTGISEKGKTFSVFIVESDREGLQKGAMEELMGMRGNPVCPILLQDCRVPSENRLGREGEGMKIALASLAGGRIGIAAQSLGIAQAALEASLKYAEERIQFGRPLAAFGATKNVLADTATRIDAARLLILRAAFLRDRGEDHVKASAMAKLCASDTAVQATRTGLQLLGGYGYSKSYAMERYYRDAKVCEIYEGTSEVQRVLIARSLLKG